MTNHPGNAPAVLTPTRRAASVRRTTTHDSNRPHGLNGPVAHVAAGRDLLTRGDGTAAALDTARIDAVVDYDRVRIEAFRTDPAAPALAGLVGRSAYVGFRKTIENLLPGEFGSHGLRAQLLDDFPAAVMGNGRALRAEGIPIGARKGPLSIGICAGWADGGTLVSGYSELGPPLRVGPHSPGLESADDDPLAWHAFAPLGPHGTRRARRTDVWSDAGEGRADCFFRDSHVDGEGLETVIHEWRLAVAFDLQSRCIITAKAEAGPLPYPECPASGDSAMRLAGMPIDGLRRVVRGSLVGTSTCTHLNDTLRALEDIGFLFDRRAASA